MKKILLVMFLAIGVLGYNIVTASPDSRLYGFKQKTVDWVQSIGVSKADYKEQLALKTAELKAYEEALVWAEKEVVKMENSTGPVCPQTGTASNFKVTHDPRPEVKEKISKLKEEVAYLQEKVKE